jgi:hypothetical protein
MQRIGAAIPVRRTGSTGTSAPSEIPQVVSVAQSRSTMLKKRQIHGLLRFPLGEAAETRRPRW